MRSPCACGGETQLEHFDHPKRDLKWFLRCCACGRMSDCVATEREADGLVIDVSTLPEVRVA
jgi:hypothetical protein